MSDFNSDDFRTKLLEERDRLIDLGVKLGDASKLSAGTHYIGLANKLIFTLKVVEEYLDTGKIVIPD